MTTVKIPPIHTDMANGGSVKLLLVRAIYYCVTEEVGEDDLTGARFGEVCVMAMEHDDPMWKQFTCAIAKDREEYTSYCATMADFALMWADKLNELLKIVTRRIKCDKFTIDIYGEEKPELLMGVDKKLLKVYWVGKYV